MLSISFLHSLLKILKLFFCLALLWSELLIHPVQAAQSDLIPARIIVTTTDDDGLGSLRSAIAFLQDVI